MLELRVTVDVLVALLHLAVALETVVQFVQGGPNPPMAGPVTHALQGVRQGANALARPAQRRHRISTGQRLNETFQFLKHRGIFRAHLLPSASGAADPSRSHRWLVEEFLLSAKDGRSSQSSDT